MPVESKSNEQTNTPQDISYNEVNYFKLRSHKGLCFHVSIKMFSATLTVYLGFVEGIQSKKIIGCGTAVTGRDNGLTCNDSISYARSRRRRDTARQ